MRRIRGKLTYANAMATFALFIALGGASYAAVKLPKNSVGARQLKNEAVTAPKIKNGTITGAKLNLSSIGTVPSATDATSAVNAKTAESAKTATNASKAVDATTAQHATTADSAGTAGNAQSLGGVPASGYTQSSCASINGAVKGFAQVDGPSVSKGALTTAGVAFPYDCSGQEVKASEFVKGVYFVEFVGSPVQIALVTTVGELKSTSAEVVTDSPGVFLVSISNANGEDVEGSFNIMTP
jgi:hypothetical protein